MFFLLYPCIPRYILGKLIDKTDLPEINFYSLKHTSVLLQIALGIHMKVISKRLVHSSNSTTDMIYSHVSSSLQHEVTNKMGELLNG